MNARMDVELDYLGGSERAGLISGLTGVDDVDRDGTKANTGSALHVSNDLTDAYGLTEKEKKASRLQFLVLCWSIFVLGWNDGSLGPLLPKIQTVYEVGFDTVSRVFIVECTGIVIGGLINISLNNRYELGKMLVFGATSQILAFAIQSQASSESFSLFASSFFIGGIGLAIQDAQANGYIATVKHGEDYKMGVLNAFHGLGALVAPVSATLFSRSTLWSFHYLVSLLLSVVNTAALAFVFRFRAQDECLVQAGEIIPDDDEEPYKLKHLITLKSVHILALFLLVYIGVELTISGWMITFMLLVRGGHSGSGFISSGFFAGLTIGRIALLGVNKRLGEERALYYYICLAIGFQLVVWLVPSFVIGALFVFCIGLVLGPLYPIAMNHAGRILPRSLVTPAISWIAASGAAGSCFLPFFTGKLAAELGIESIQPFVIVMMLLMGGLWYITPKTQQRPPL